MLAAVSTLRYISRKFKLPEFSALNSTSMRLRNVKLPNARDAANITVGLGVVAADRAQVRREH